MENPWSRVRSRGIIHLLIAYAETTLGTESSSIRIDMG